MQAKLPAGQTSSDPRGSLAGTICGHRHINVDEWLIHSLVPRPDMVREGTYNAGGITSFRKCRIDGLHCRKVENDCNEVSAYDTAYGPFPPRYIRCEMFDRFGCQARVRHFKFGKCRIKINGRSVCREECCLHVSTTKHRVISADTRGVDSNAKHSHFTGPCTDMRIGS